MVKDFRNLPRFEDNLSYLYVEHAIVERDEHSIVIIDKRGRTTIPCNNLATILLGNGTSITHAAISLFADVGCSVLWCGEEGVRFYAQGMGRTHKSKNTLLQAALVSSPPFHMKVVQNMYQFRFKEQFSSTLSLSQLRGMEGARMRNIYQKYSKDMEIPWHGRDYDHHNFGRSDPINQALTVGNSCLYGICHAAIVIAGYSPSLGFIHTGNQLSFVFDIADLYKTELVIPLAFKLVKESTDDISSRMRHHLRDVFYEQKIMKRIIPDISSLLHVNDEQGNPVTVSGIEIDDTNFLWESTSVSGGVNYQ